MPKKEVKPIRIPPVIKCAGCNYRRPEPKSSLCRECREDAQRKILREEL